MIVYKAMNLYLGWTEGGPQGAVYDISSNGWFDAKTFERWFFELFLPAVESKPGVKVLIGDNLGSHFSHAIIEATILHHIKFITMPPNATHLCQPLAVAVFRGLKGTWKNILYKWRLESRVKGRHSQRKPPNTFPSTPQWP